MLKPTKEWVVVEVLKEEENITPSGLVLLNPIEKKFKKCKIVLFGPEANKTNELKIGDVVLCMKDHGLKVEHEDKQYEFMKEQNFLGIIE